MTSNYRFRRAKLVTVGTVSAVAFAALGSAKEVPEFAVKKVAKRPLASLPKGDLYWTAETFSTLDAVRAAMTDAAVEIDGTPWLLTLGPEDKVGHGGRWKTSIGPIDRFEASAYMLRINVSDAPPVTRTSVHSHSGSEAMYVLSGEFTVRWPSKTSVIKARGGSSDQPPHTPMLA